MSKPLTIMLLFVFSLIAVYGYGYVRSLGADESIDDSAFIASSPTQPDIYASSRGSEIDPEIIKKVLEDEPVYYPVEIALIKRGDLSMSTHAVMREVENKCDIEAVMKLLLAGPTEEENNKGGYSTAIPADVKLISAGISDDGTVHVKFSQELQVNGGPDWVDQIRDQIQHTIWWMDCYQDVPDLLVWIDIDGVNHEEVLQAVY